MKTEKKLIAFSAIALLIGVASIAPMLFLMSGTANAQTELSKPWSSLNIPYAYCNPNSDYSNITGSYTSAGLNAVGSIAISPDALTNADAQIEYYQLQVYSDQGPIYSMTYFVGVSKPDYLVNMYKTTLYFADGNTYSTNVTNGNGGMIIYDLNSSNTFHGLIGGSIISEALGSIPQEITQLRNAEKLYIDVSRLCTFTFNGNMTVVTTGSSDVIQHIELTKTENGFVYGSTAGINPPFPIEGPTTTNSPPTIFTPDNSTMTPSNVFIPDPLISQGIGSTIQP